MERETMLKRVIPSSGEELPVIGMGTWQTFDVPGSRAYPGLEAILARFGAAGGRVIDSSPMYGRAEEVIGDITSGMKTRDGFFYATKVWTRGLREGIGQMETSLRIMRRESLDLIQIHNLTDWRTQLPTLRRWKETGRIRYFGITHYADSSHEELERILRTEKLDFVQFNYSIDSRNAEKRLLDAAADRGVAALINRPFGEGRLFQKVKGKALPRWAAEWGVETWGAYFLKYLVSHPAVTCVIPATAHAGHMADNLAAGFGELPDEPSRRKMVEFFEAL